MVNFQKISLGLPKILKLVSLKTKQILLSLFLCIYSVTLLSQNSYKIQIRINDLPDSICYLAVYYGDKMHLIDTAEVDKRSKIVFTGDKKLSNGIYILAGEKNNKLLEFIINKKQKFKLKTDNSHLINNMEVSGSEENKMFYKYLKYNSINYNKIKALKENSDKRDSANNIENQIRSINKDIESFKLNFINKNSNLFFSKVLLAMQEPEIPSELSNKKEKYIYFKNHFWDNIDLTNDGLLRTPVIDNKLKLYFKNLIPKQSDSIISAIDKILSKTKINSELFEYLVWDFTSKYEQSKIMGFDKIFVHMADNYFKEEMVKEENKEIASIIIERAQKIKPILIGKPAPNLILLDTNNKLTSFQSIENKYTLIIFWDDHCGTCKKEIKELKKLYDAKKFDLEIFAVCTDTSLSAWKEYVNDHNLNWINVNGTRSITKDYHQLYDIFSTPVIYILDDKKKIIAKKIKASQIEDFLINFLKNQSDK